MRNLQHTRLSGYLYISRKTPGFESKAIQMMLLAARNDNRRMGVTGCLYYYGGYFVQFFEGPRRAAKELYQRILEDKRHTDITTISEGEHRHRLFPRFLMSFHELSGNAALLKERFITLQTFLSQADRHKDNRHYFDALVQLTKLVLDPNKEPYDYLDSIPENEEKISVHDLQLILP